MWQPQARRNGKHANRGDVVGVVLAAGRGRRLGGPKALLRWPAGDIDVPLAVAHVRAWAFCKRVLVVTRADIADVLRAHAPSLPAELVVSTALDALGPAGSLAAAAHLVDDEALMLVTPVDCPPVRDDTVSALLAAMREDQVGAARPRCGDRRGHPVILRPSVWQRYRQATPPLRDVLHELKRGVVEVEVSDEGVLRDIDRPGDIDGVATFFGP